MNATDALNRIIEILYPEGDPQHEWSSDELPEIALVIEEYVADTRVKLCSDCIVFDGIGWNEEFIGRPLPDPAPMSLLPDVLISKDPTHVDCEGHFAHFYCDGCRHVSAQMLYCYVAVPKPEAHVCTLDAMGNCTSEQHDWCNACNACTEWKGEVCVKCGAVWGEEPKTEECGDHGANEPTCDVCGKGQCSTPDMEWNGETGNHASCESGQAGWIAYKAERERLGL